MIASFMQQNVFIPEKEITVRFEIWDTAGQERYRSLAPMYYRGATAAVVVYDITKKESFAGAKSWVKELKRRGEDNVVIALAGNKCDMETKRKVETEDAVSFADQSGLIFMETSALNNTNIKELFLALARKLPLEPVQSDAAGSGGIKLVTPNKQSGSKVGCC